MTNQEAIIYLEAQLDCMCSEDCQIYTGYKDCPQGFICTDVQALLTAISALQAQEELYVDSKCKTCRYYHDYDDVRCMICDDENDMYEEKEAKHSTESSLTQKGLDTISRQAAIETINEQIEYCNKALGSFDISPKDEYAVKVERASLEVYKEQLENLPSAQPERNTGWWLIREGISDAQCSECGMYFNDVYDM